MTTRNPKAQSQASTQDPAAPGASAAPALARIDVTGFSPTFSFEEAIQDALAQAVAMLPAPPRNPDVAVSIEVKRITARTAGNIRPGLLIEAVAR